MRERFFDWLASGSARHPWRFLIAAFLVFLAGAGMASTLVPKLTWMDLLPQDEPQVIEYAKIIEDYGTTEIVLMSLEGPDPAQLLEAAGVLEERLLALRSAAGDPFVQRVVYGEELDFALAHGLMLVEADDLDQMLDNGLLDAPGIASVVSGYNRMFKAEYVDESDESLESQESGAVRAIDSMWALPRTLRWYLENPDASAAEKRAEVEAAVRRFTVGEQHYFSDDKSMLLLMVQPRFSIDDWNYALPGVQLMRDELEAVLREYPDIGENYAGPWEVTNIWKAMMPYVEHDPAEVELLRLQLPYKVPAIAPLDKVDSGTGMTGMQVIVDDETMTMFHDFGWNMLLAFVAVLALFVVTFRMWASPLMAMVVLTMSITLALGVNAVVLGELTMMAIMFPIILLGLGVDYFVHILGEFTQRRGAGESIEHALRATLQRTGKGVVTGGLTTAMAFLALGLTSFRGFTDFGISAGIGVLCTLLTSLLVLPSALVVLHRRQERRAQKKGKPLAPKSVIQFRFLEVTGTLAHRFWPVTLGVVAVLTVFLGMKASEVGWAKDLLDVEAENLASVELNEVLEERFYLHPDSLVVSATSLEEAWQLTDALDDLGTINLVDSISYMLPPPGEQRERAERVTEIRDRISGWGEAPAFAVDEETEHDSSARRVDAFLKALYQMDCNVITIRKSAYMAGQDRLYKMADRLVREGESCVEREEGKPRPAGGWPRVAASDDVKAIAAFAKAHPDAMPALLDAFQEVFHPALARTYAGMANPEPITLETLPKAFRDRYQSTEGSEFLITAYPSGDVWNEDFQARMFAEVAEVSDRVTGTPPLFVATIERGAQEGKKATLYSLIAITLLLLIDFWGLRKGHAKTGIISSILALIPLILGAVWTVGFMTLLDIELNMANVIAIPLILGIGIDNGVHVIHRYRIEGVGNIGTVMGTVGRAILLTSITTIAAFGTFAFGLYRGLSSMGVILAIGITICFLLSAYLLPALFGALERMGVELLIALLLCGAGWAADFDTQAGSHLRWKGYVENQLGTLVLPHRPERDDWKDLPLFDTNKARLDLRAKPAPGFTANINTIARLYHGTRTFRLDEMLPEKFHEDLALLEAFAPEYGVWSFENDLSLNDVYLTAQEGRFRVRVGKQPIRFGAGYVWNPTDPFTVIDMLDPTYERVGVNAVRAQVHLPSEGLIEAYALPGENLSEVTLEHTGLAFRGRLAAGQWVFAATYAGFQDTAGFDPLALSLEDSVVETRRHLAGAEVTGELGGVGLWTEAAYNRMARPRSGLGNRLSLIGEEEWVEVLGGATYTFRGGFTVLAEGLYNGRGVGDPDDYSLEQWFAYLDQTLRYLGTGYGTATLQMPVSRIHTLFSLTAIGNLSDRSAIVNPWITYDWNQYLAISLYGVISLADSDTKEVAELGATGQAAYLRARLSF